MTYNRSNLWYELVYTPVTYRTPHFELQKAIFNGGETLNLHECTKQIPDIEQRMVVAAQEIIEEAMTPVLYRDWIPS